MAWCYSVADAKPPWARALAVTSNGCHTDETRTSFQHVGRSVTSRDGFPAGISAFTASQLPGRAQSMKALFCRPIACAPGSHEVVPDRGGRPE